MRRLLALLAAATAIQWDAAWRRIVPKVETTWSEASIMRNVAPEAVGAVTTATLDAHVLNGGFLSARRGAPSAEYGWETEPFQMRSGTSKALEGRGTLILNGVAETIPECARCALAALDAFEAPCSLNCYATGPGTKVAAPPHADAQGVLVLQTCGSQRWRVWDGRPFYASELNTKLTAGKGAPLTLEEPFLDVILKEGDALYAPAGWPHATSTLEDTSVHLTLGLDHAIFGLDRFSLARALAARDSGSRLEVDDAVALPFWSPMNVGATLQYLERSDAAARDVAVAFAAHAYRIVEAQARLYEFEDASPEAWRQRWRRWADESCRYVMAHNQFIAGDAFALEDPDPEMAEQNDLFSRRELEQQGY
ncbi:unnamed protein product [Pelagomonas calceolata]|uniref:Bifunctional lysine-specific demethylase and histidyl-hydroxylase n=2 Tax=Pelagomonas calceolata TaxID=35677 RepID=A0A8J2ST32_9STRA|nr:unnamed protein product [Pelagomonas calceolata]